MNQVIDLKTIVLKSGFRINVESGDTFETVARTEIEVRGKMQNEEWVDEIYKVEHGFLKLKKGDRFWEIRESEIAVYEFVDRGELNI